MDNKTTVIAIAVLFLVVMGYWMFLVRYVYPKHPEWDYAGTLNEQRQQQPATTEPSTGPAETESSTQPTTAASNSAAPGATLLVASTQPAGGGGAKVIGSMRANDPNYGLGLQLDPRGAGLDSVTINSYKATDAKELYVFQAPYADAPDQLSLSAQSVTIDGQLAQLNSADWRLEPGSSAASATYGVDITSLKHAPLLHIDKTYQVHERGPKSNRDNTAAGYEVSVTYHLRNLAGKPLKNIRLDFNGPTMPPRELERTDDRQIVSGYDKGDQAVDLTRDYLSTFKASLAEKDLSIYKGHKFLWSGMSSNYFAAIVLPATRGQLSVVQALCLNPDAEADEHEVTLDFQTGQTSLAAGGSYDVPLSVFFGPKERDLMEEDFYGDFPRGYNQLLATSGSMCELCAPQWLVDRLVDLLRIFHFFLRDWGLAIIALVILVRVILHPISKYSQVSMLRLQKMGPELERLKKKYANDKDALAKAQMEMHKEMGITPFLGCLPMFLQTPIWIALYSALENDIALRQAPFLWGWTWIHDLSQPDHVISWGQHPFTVPILGMKIVSLNILPLIVAVMYFLQQKFQPQPPAMNPEQASQQKMMKYMSLLFSLFFYWMPSGLNLYILTSSGIAIFESKIIRDHIKQRQEREQANKVIVDVKPTRHGKQSQKQVAAPEKRGCLGGWWSNLQEKAEEIRREAEKKAKR